MLEKQPSCRCEHHIRRDLVRVGGREGRVKFGYKDAPVYENYNHGIWVGEQPFTSTIMLRRRKI